MFSIFAFCFVHSRLLRSFEKVGEPVCSVSCSCACLSRGGANNARRRIQLRASLTEKSLGPGHSVGARLDPHSRRAQGSAQSLSEGARDAVHGCVGMEHTLSLGGPWPTSRCSS